MKYWKSVWQWGQHRFEIFAVMSRCEKTFRAPFFSYVRTGMDGPRNYERS